MLILTNCKALRYSEDYLKNINLDFKYFDTNVFTLVNFSPDIIVSNDSEEMVRASNKYPAIKFVGPDLKFPNYHFNIPDFLLDEICLTNRYQQKPDFPQCDISYFNEFGIDKYELICKLRGLGNTKIAGQGFCCDELIKNFPQRLTPKLYESSRFVAASTGEEILKALFLGKPCISDINFKYVTHIDSISNLSQANWVGGEPEFAWQYSHTNVWSTIFDVLDMSEESTRMKQAMEFKK